ncbi:hypothetical protein M878_02725 [Streptomyces roseochromogenus subsp. oscitans DS 12.976]|uniref:Luciferase-like domain-containing protein n=1 Tax=Streptomyces roseochromogenus subsp. oscitans DS 12.976 TaxID=1352936 RepID=V6KVV1_STRRC|nr:hypothetical protein M878_02725 [Streptomyces roseochromogenus subsp. oscitans DS 12.976]
MGRHCGDPRLRPPSADRRRPGPDGSGHHHLGLALGIKYLTETGFGIPHERPVARLREFLTAPRPLLATGSADFHGELLTAATPLSAAVPGAEPPVPILVAAMGPQTLRVSGGLADGILPLLAGPRALAEHIVSAVTAATEAAGRPALRIVAFVPGVVTADVEAVRRTATDTLPSYEQFPSCRRAIARSGGIRAVDLAVIGDEEAVAAEARRYRSDRGGCSPGPTWGRRTSAAPGSCSASRRTAEAPGLRTATR